MAKHEPGWELYRSFLAVAQEGSLSAAARALGMTQPSLGRHIRELEAGLGVALFTRSPQGLRLTDLGSELIAHAQSMAAASAALRRAASGGNQDERGTVRITCSDVVGAEVLPAILADFRRQHPGIAVELSLSNRNEDLLRKDADIAVRMVRPTQAALLTRRVGSIMLGLHAHRRYLKEHGRPRRIEDLARHALIGYDRETPALRAIARALSLEHSDFSLRTDNDLGQLAAIRAGYGIGVCQCALAARDRELVRLLPESFTLGMDTWLAMHEDLRTDRRVRLLFDYLAEAIKTYAAGAAG